MKKDKRDTHYYDVHDPKTDEHICRVGYYTDPVVDKPTGIGRLLDFIPIFNKQVEKGEWKGFAFDSVSFANLLSRKYHQYELNPDTSNPLQWYGGAADRIEELLCLQLPSMLCDVGVSFHVHRRKISEDDGGKMSSVKQPFVPGKRMEETKMVAAAWPELYRIYIKKDGEKRHRILQTEPNGSYQAGTCIGLPDGLRIPRKVQPEFLWQGYPGKDRPPAHIGIYSDPHLGKSTFLAGVLRRPFYVAFFDGVGKDMAYRALGMVKE